MQLLCQKSLAAEHIVTYYNYCFYYLSELVAIFKVTKFVGNMTINVDTCFYFICGLKLHQSNLLPYGTAISFQ